MVGLLWYKGHVWTLSFGKRTGIYTRRLWHSGMCRCRISREPIVEQWALNDLETELREPSDLYDKYQLYAGMDLIEFTAKLGYGHQIQDWDELNKLQPLPPPWWKRLWNYITAR